MLNISGHLSQFLLKPQLNTKLVTNSGEQLLMGIWIIRKTEIHLLEHTKELYI